MANHLTPSQLAERMGRDRVDVIHDCVEMGVPIYQGKVDKRLFEASLRHREAQRRARRAA